MRAMLELAKAPQGLYMSLRELASRQEISAKYLEQLLIPLKGAGLVKSVRGAKGGYALARDPRQVNVYDIVKVLEGPVTLVDCVEDPEYCRRQNHCAVHLMWAQMSKMLADHLAAITLADLVDRDEQVLQNCRLAAANG